MPSLVSATVAAKETPAPTSAGTPVTAAARFASGGRDTSMEIRQGFGALRPIGDRIALEIEDAVWIMLLQLLGSLTFPDAKTDLGQTRIKLHRQRQAF